MNDHKQPEYVDAVVVGGGPAGATAATCLARAGYSVMLLDKGGRIKPCGGAIPPRLIEDFAIPDALVVARVNSARIVSPSERYVDMPIDNGYVGMVDRDEFDEWLRERAAAVGAERRTGAFRRIIREDSTGVVIEYKDTSASGGRETRLVHARALIGADGANSAVGKQTIPGADCIPYVAAYHEIITSPAANDRNFDPARCDVIYRGTISPDFYGWVFPHGKTTSVGVGSAVKGFSLRGAVDALRADAGLEGAETIRREGAPIPLQPLKRWDNGRNVILAGDAAGIVAPASGEGIYYAMVGGQYAAEAVIGLLHTGDARALKMARKRFMKAHGQVFRMLGMMQRFWYANDGRRERFVRICGDPDVQFLTWDSYMHKRLTRARPMAHARIFFKNIAHLTGLAPA
ncbi:geranylgeranyl reductase [Natronocella acetinitrilica]|uniref:Geranylgeranyl reductase n=1 Tax=Natronocella acetinitrilica TaxID=414046 RepID=A0AAE3G6B0_9GAMM|nr:geranylgeranyl diphosphate reductase [Natronocella acetinitrilica]MCP1675824.1 geranylgeranyl reductase [Natronocella acetinitrilica]